MTFKDFCRRINVIARRAKQFPVFTHEDGRHIARFPDGSVIIGNTVSARVLVKWGSGHTAMATI